VWERAGTILKIAPWPMAAMQFLRARFDAVGVNPGSIAVDRNAPNRSQENTILRLPVVGDVRMRSKTLGDVTRDPVLVDLALQGGGSHGAFTWGVLDRLLEEPWLRIEAISGTSAGAMNAAVLADGWTENGAAGAHRACFQCR